MHSSFRVTMVLAWILLFGSAGTAFAQRPITVCNVYCIALRARDALVEHRHADYLAEAQQFVARAPDLPSGAYMLARAYALTGQDSAVISQLLRAADIGATQDPASDSVFAGILQMPAYREVQLRLEQNCVPLVRGSLALELPDSGFPPTASRSWQARSWNAVRRS